MSRVRLSHIARGSAERAQPRHMTNSSYRFPRSGPYNLRPDKTGLRASTMIDRHRYAVLLACLFAAACGSSTSDDGAATRSPGAPPATRIEVVADTYHGTRVDDPYRWLEDWDSQEVKTWSEAQSTYARDVLNELPGRPAIRARMEQLYTSPQTVVYEKAQVALDGTLLLIKHDPEKQHGILVAMNGDADPASERVVVDPNAIDPTSGTVIDWYRPSHDGSKVAVSLSSQGSELGDIHLFETASGDRIDVVVPGANGATAGGDLVWFPDDSGFYYTRYPRPGERPDDELHLYQQVWDHTLGTSGDEDRYVLGRDFPRIAASRLRIDRASGRLAVWTQDGDSGRFQTRIRQPDGRWVRVSEFDDALEEPFFGPDDSLMMLSREGAPRGRIVRLDAANPDSARAVEVIPETEWAISHGFYHELPRSMVVADDRIYVSYQAGGPNELVSYSLAGEELDRPEHPPVATLSSLRVVDGTDLIFAAGSYVAAPQWYRYSAADGKSVRLAMSPPPTGDTSNVEIVREFATSRDGTRVPMTILVPQGVRKDGTNAVVVFGYGGFGVSVRPSPTPHRQILAEHGVLYVAANLRGGGEYGAEWHREGRTTEKQNVFDDFIAVLQHLVDEGYAAADRVGIYGSSNGGLLMGAITTQRPDLVSAVVSHVGVYDMLRLELDPNGEFTVPEYGSVKDERQFDALHAYSPYHRIEAGRAYPPTLLMTAANDPRVNASHSRKFAARLQHAQSGDGVVLLRTSGNAGHGINASLDRTIERRTDQYAFLLHHIGVPTDSP